jgi:hypothetical protein
MPASASITPTWGYYLVGGDGGVFSFGATRYGGGLGGSNSGVKIVAALDETTIAGHNGYLLVSDKGVVYPFAGGFSYGDLRSVHLDAPIVGAVAVQRGYLMVGADGGVFTFGSAGYRGSLAGKPLDSPIAAIGVYDPYAAQAGYWLVSQRGRVYAFNLPWHGDARSLPLRGRIVAIQGQSNGYWLAASDGGVFAYGNAHFYGSMANTPLAAPIVAMFGFAGGYCLTGADGGLFFFPASPLAAQVFRYAGGMAGRRLDAPIAAFIPEFFPAPGD